MRHDFFGLPGSVAFSLFVAAAPDASTLTVAGGVAEPGGWIVIAEAPGARICLSIEEAAAFAEILDGSAEDARAAPFAAERWRRLAGALRRGVEILSEARDATRH